MLYLFMLYNLSSNIYIAEVFWRDKLNVASDKFKHFNVYFLIILILFNSKEFFFQLYSKFDWNLNIIL